MALAVSALRAFVCRHRALAIGLAALALAMKALVPAGFMTVAAGSTISVVICDGHGDGRIASIALPGSPGDESGAAKAAKTCPFSVLSADSLGGTDIVLVAALLLFILASGSLPLAISPLRRADYLMPPGRAPPARH